MAASRATRVTLEQRLDFIGLDSPTRQNLRNFKPLLSREIGPALGADINTAVSEMDQAFVLDAGARAKATVAAAQAGRSARRQPAYATAGATALAVRTETSEWEEF